MIEHTTDRMTRREAWHIVFGAGIGLIGAAWIIPGNQFPISAMGALIVGVAYGALTQT